MFNKLNEKAKDIYNLLTTPSEIVSSGARAEAIKVWNLVKNLPLDEDLTGPLGRLLDDHDSEIEISENTRKVFSEIYNSVSGEKSALQRKIGWAKNCGSWTKENGSSEIELDCSEESLEDTFRSEFDSDTDSGFTDILEMYKSANADEKAIINAIFVNLCGWSIPSLINLAKTEEKGKESA